MLDERYFYFVGNIGHCSCGIVRDAVTEILLHHRPESLLGNDWVDAIKECPLDCPSLQGFLTELLCLNHISMFGLKHVDMNLEAMPISRYTYLPDFGSLKDIPGTTCCQLYIPRASNYDAIDGIIVLRNKTKRTLKLFPLQITIADRHSDSEAKFFETWWLQYLDAAHQAFGTNLNANVTSKPYKISLSFVWIQNNPKVIAGLKKNVPMNSYRGYPGPGNYDVYKLPIQTILPDFKLKA